MNRPTYSEKALSKYLKAVVWGTLFGGIICATLLFVSAFLLVKAGFVPENAANIVTMIISCFSVIFGSYIAARLLGKKGLLVGFCVGLTMFLIVMTVSLSLTGETLTALTLTKAAIMIISGAIGGVIGVNKKQASR